MEEQKFEIILNGIGIEAFELGDIIMLHLKEKNKRVYPFWSISVKEIKTEIVSSWASYPGA